MDVKGRWIVTGACGPYNLEGSATSSSSSSSWSEEENEDDDDDNDDDESDDDQASTSSSDVDEETIKLIDKVVKNIHKLNVKGVPIQIEDCLFTNQRREQRKKECYGSGKIGHFVEDCPNKPTPK